MGNTGMIDWAGVSHGSGDGSGALRLKLESGGQYRIRPVHNPLEIWSYWGKGSDGKTIRCITADSENCPIKDKYNVQPSLRYAVNVIDRADGKLKVMEGPPSVFKAIKDWAEATGNDPGTSSGGDFSIKVTGQGMNTKYTCMFINQIPFSDEEKAMITEQGLFKLKDLYKPMSPDEIEQKMFGSNQQQNNGSANNSSPVADDVFGDSDNESNSNAASNDDFNF